MPDWTYFPLRPLAAALLGERRSRLAALAGLAAAGSLPGGGRVVAWALGHRHPPAGLAGTVSGVPLDCRLGATVPPAVARDAVRALPLVGAGVIEIGPVTAADVPLVRAAAAGRRVPVIVRAAAPAVAAALADHVDAVGTDPAGVLRLAPGPPTAPASSSVGAAAAALADPAVVVLATPGLLVAEGPGWFGRVLEAATPVRALPPVRAAVAGLGRDPRRWPGWWWALLLGAGLIAVAVVGAAVTLGPVLLWYDRDYLRTDLAGLRGVNPHLVEFLRHDRVSVAGATAAIGVLYVGLALGGLRRGWPWARDLLALSGLIGFVTVLYLLRYRYVEPAHLAASAALLPVYLAAVLAPPEPPGWTVHSGGPDRGTRRAFAGQLLMIATGFGVLVGGVVVSVVGLTHVFVAADGHYLHGAPTDPRLLSFIAHDRAGFGGSLVCAGTTITLLAGWGWQRGAAWVWWTLALAAATGFGPTLGVHWAIHYTDRGHLGPVYLAVALTAVALALSRPYLCARPTRTARPAARAPAAGQ